MAAFGTDSSSKGLQPAASGQPAVGNRPFVISEQEIPKIQIEALKGDAASAYKLAQYYAFAVFDTSTSQYWMQVAAENGDARGMYAVGQSLARSENRNDKIRASYWLERVLNEGSEPTRSLALNLLKELGFR